MGWAEHGLLTHAHGTQTPSLPLGEADLSLPAAPQIGRIFEYQVSWEDKDLLYTLDLSYLAWFPQEPWEGGKAGLTRHLTNKETEAQIPSYWGSVTNLPTWYESSFCSSKLPVCGLKLWNVDNECLSLEQCVISRGCTITIIRYFISILICTYSSDFVVMVNTFLSWRKYSAPWALLFCHSLY